MNNTAQTTRREVIKLVDQALKNQEGGTNWLNSTPKRYVVGVTKVYMPSELIVRIDDLRDREAVERVLDQLAYIMDVAKSNNEGVGFWAHEDRLYFDVVRGYNDRAKALFMANSLNEIAIFDTKKGECINVKA